MPWHMNWSRQSVTTTDNFFAAGKGEAEAAEDHEATAEPEADPDRIQVVVETEGGDANGDATLDAKDDADNDEHSGNKRARRAKQKEEEVKESSGHEFSHRLPEATVNYFLSQKQIFDHQEKWD